MTGLGRVVGAGNDMVILGVVGLSGGGGAGNLCVHLDATFAPTEPLVADAGELCG